MIGAFDEVATKRGLLTWSLDGRNVEVAQEFSFQRPQDVGGETIVVPAGVLSDGASIPREAWDIMPPFGPYWRAAVTHDAVYRGSQRTRFECDLILLEAMRALHVDERTARLIYNAVSEFGQSAFDLDRARMAIAMRLAAPPRGANGTGT